ncbi:MAG: DUF2793 domain-containing protein [Boseongicola sp.]|nr:MAG: DUF2793 domain-containing protein [Boseongicola sp.]
MIGLAPLISKLRKFQTGLGRGYMESLRSMTNTAQFALPLVQPAQAQKHVTVNEALLRLDALAQITLNGVGMVTPPGLPTEGELYDIGASATGDWASQDGKLGLFSNGGWVFVQPKTGWRGWRVDTGSAVTYDGATWVEGGGSFTANGAGFVHRSIEVDHAVGTGASSAISAFISSNSIVYGITGRVLSAVGGATSIEIGVTGSTNRYGSGIGVGAGSWARGLTGNPLTYYSDTDLILTATGGNFDGTGTFRVAVHFAELTLPRA